MFSSALKKTYFDYIYVAVISFIALSALAFYFSYAWHAWFLQDDFGFLQHYASSLQFSELLHPSADFGRFVSRNLYWHFMQRLFGTHATNYFLVNLSLLILISGLIYVFIRSLQQDAFVAFAIAVSYFISEPTLYNYTWLSNTQHLLAHALIFILLSFAICSRAFVSGHYLAKIILILIYILGINANALTLFALPPLLLYVFLQDKQAIFNYLDNKIFIGLLLLITLVFLFVAKSNATGVYETSISWPVIRQNLSYYVGHIYKPRYTIPFIFVGFGYGLYRAISQADKVLLLLITLGLTFYIPFAFLRYQHYPNYMALPFLFLMASLIYLAKNHRLIILLLIILQLTMLNKNVLLYYKNHPAGADTKYLITQLNVLTLASDHTVCLKPTKPEDILCWYALDSGTALKLFGKPGIDYSWVNHSQDIPQKCLFITVDQQCHII